MSQPLLEVQSFLAARRWGMLATRSTYWEGFPFGSVVRYDFSADGVIVILVARISEHYKNLAADPRASLLVVEDGGVEDPQPLARATLLLRFERTDEPARKGAYLARFPETRLHEEEHGFTFLKGICLGVRWIKGFGEIHRLDGPVFGTPG